VSAVAVARPIADICLAVAVAFSATIDHSRVARSRRRKMIASYTRFDNEPRGISLDHFPCFMARNTTRRDATPIAQHHRFL
jgi:hypothetical protein